MLQNVFDQELGAEEIIDDPEIDQINQIIEASKQKMSPFNSTPNKETDCWILGGQTMDLRAFKSPFNDQIIQNLKGLRNQDNSQFLQNWKV